MSQIEINNNLRKIPFIVYVALCVFFLASVQISFLLFDNTVFLSLGLAIVFFLVCRFHPHIFILKYVSMKMSFLFFLAAILAQRGNINAYIECVFIIAPFLLFLFLKDVYKLDFIIRFNNLLATLVCVSLAFFILHLIGLPLPHYSISWKSYIFDNYYFFMIIPSTYYALERFQFIFTEPGYFACLMVFMIILNKYDFKKWQVNIYLVALIFTYSLAGYLFFVLGLLPFIFYKSKNKGLYLFILFILLGGFLILLNSESDNFVTSMFSSRLQFGEDRFSYYNRTSDHFEYWFQNFFIPSGDWLFGENEAINQIFSGEGLVGVDLRVYFARYGIFPIIFYFGSMLYYYSKKHSLFGLWYALIFIIFYFRGYTVMYYMGFPMLYIIGLLVFEYEQDTKQRLL